MVACSKVETIKQKRILVLIRSFSTASSNRLVETKISPPISSRLPNTNTMVTIYIALSQIFITTMLTIFSLIFTCLLDESPRWLLANGHYSKALDVIQ